MTLREKVAKELEKCFGLYVGGEMMWRDWPGYTADRVIALVKEETPCK